MDALFIPLAEATGASVDQIKVRFSSSANAKRLLGLLTANHLLTHFFPAGKRICPNPA